MMMKTIFLLGLLFLTSCMQTFNSNTGDEGLIGNCVVGDAPLKAAYTVLRSKCMSCHTKYHNSWSTNCTKQAWIDSGSVISGDIVNSNLLIRMKNYSPPGDMPLSSPAISASEYTILTDWISGM
jgi:hypothetical protein